MSEWYPCPICGVTHENMCKCPEPYIQQPDEENTNPMTTLKTAEEWMEQFKLINSNVNNKLRPLTNLEMDNHVKRLKDLFSQIQSNAIAHGRELGLREAAELCLLNKKDVTSKHWELRAITQEANGMCNLLSDKILFAIATKKEGE